MDDVNLLKLIIICIYVYIYIYVYCTEEQEKCFQVLACKNRIKSQHKFATVLSWQFKNNDTSLVMSIRILYNIKRLQQSESPSFINKPISTHKYLINLTITAQTAIGWDNLLRGLLSPIWNSCHQQWEKE